jgi:hypothetical protein
VREAQVADPTTLVEGYPRALADAVTRALALDPADRWQTAAELRDALDAYASSTGQTVDASSVRALLTDLFAEAKPAAWGVLADEVGADQARTRVWDQRKEKQADPVGPLPAPVPPPRRHTPPTVPLRLVAIGGVSAVLGALVVGLTVKACRGGKDASSLEERVSRIEDLLGMTDAGSSAASGAVAPSAAPPAVSLDDNSAACALAKVAAYRVWHEAVARAKVNAAPAQAACAEIWNDTRKQACYRSAMAQLRATQAARDTVIEGGTIAHEAVKAVKEDAKNEAVGRARSASQAAFAACDEPAD